MRWVGWFRDPARARGSGGVSEFSVSVFSGISSLLCGCSSVLPEGWLLLIKKHRGASVGKRGSRSRNDTGKQC